MAPLVPVGVSASLESAVASHTVSAASALHSHSWKNGPTGVPTELPTVVGIPTHHTPSSKPHYPHHHSTPVSSNATPTPSPDSTTGGSSGLKDSYKLYKGDGSSGAGWPSMDKWVSSFDSMWSSNLPLIKKGCPEGVPANSDAENDELKAAIQSAASGSKLDPRFILAAVVQESKGCVRVPSTKYSVLNPGLLQDHEGKGTCNPATSPPGTPKQQCSKDDIDQMINDGIFGKQAPGTATGDGYLQVFDQAGTTAKGDKAQQYYIAARLYNSGSEVANRLECGVATHCYSSDIANRLTGWVNAKSLCQEASVNQGCPASSGA